MLMNDFCCTRLLWRGGSCIRKKGQQQQQYPFLKHPCFMTIAAFDNNQFQGSPFFFWMHLFLTAKHEEEEFPR
jgi:hypothetical protein